MFKNLLGNRRLLTDRAPDIIVGRLSGLCLLPIGNMKNTTDQFLVISRLWMHQENLRRNPQNEPVPMISKLVNFIGFNRMHHRHSRHPLSDMEVNEWVRLSQHNHSLKKEWPEVIRLLLSSKRRSKFKIRKSLRGNKNVTTALVGARIKDWLCWWRTTELFPTDRPESR
jgi:hypothetical protein